MSVDPDAFAGALQTPLLPSESPAVRIPASVLMSSSASESGTAVGLDGMLGTETTRALFRVHHRLCRRPSHLAHLRRPGCSPYAEDARRCARPHAGKLARLVKRHDGRLLIIGALNRYVDGTFPCPDAALHPVAAVVWRQNNDIVRAVTAAPKICAPWSSTLPPRPSRCGHSSRRATSAAARTPRSRSSASP